MPAVDLRAAFDEPTLRRILDQPQPPPQHIQQAQAVVWRDACQLVQGMRSELSPGCVEWTVLGRAYRALLGLDVDGSWTDLLAGGVVGAAEVAAVRRLESPGGLSTHRPPSEEVAA